MQHAWATAVETVDLFEGQRLKFGGGEEDWRRFFALIAHTMAEAEDCNGVPGVPAHFGEVVEELKHWTRQLNMVEVLGAAQTLLAFDPPPELGGSKVFLLRVDLETERVEIRGFNRRAEAFGSEEYLQLEKEAEGNPRVWIVLVGADSLEDVKSAYPNAFLDTELFRFVLTDMLEKA